MTLTLSAKPAATLLNSNRGSARRVSCFVLVGNGEVAEIFAFCSPILFLCGTCLKLASATTSFVAKAAAKTFRHRS